MKCRALLYKMSKTAFSKAVELYFTTIPGTPGVDMEFLSGEFAIRVVDPSLFNILEPGEQYQVELSIVVRPKDA